ncbi:hypothetical protein C4900_08045 [Acidiferrobacter thiooxydans]|uniref:Uncharacterized protein n=1 Tax=Acidiferrobacter thiooxydans TaxID=163359 RepID=A0A1C2G0P9_9GAMM|nr:hypothetical protein C4900_08045 [Acidiferrobacter thiooxydans]
MGAFASLRIERRTQGDRLNGASLTATSLAPVAKRQDLGDSRAAQTGGAHAPRLHPDIGAQSAAL